MQTAIKDKINYQPVPFVDFMFTLEEAQSTYARVAESTTPYQEIFETDGTICYMDQEAESGFMVSETGELTGLFSLIRGRGKALVTEALKRGACHLDCFDGFLVDFYKRHGFMVTARQANWNEGEPDVVYMGRF